MFNIQFFQLENVRYSIILSHTEYYSISPTGTFLYVISLLLFSLAYCQRAA